MSDAVPATATPAYRPRNVLNAPAVKAAIARRSTERRDSDAVLAWLTNHFFRWVVGSFEPARPVRGPEDFAALPGPPQAPPDWLRIQWQSPRPADAWHVDPEHPALVAWESRLVEFLGARVGTRLAHKLQRITCTAAMALWEEEHRRIASQRGKGWAPSSGQALRACLQTAHGTFFEIVSGDEPGLREELAYETFHMQHCLGQFADRRRLTGGYGEHHVRSVRDGTLRLFTLRGPTNQPHVTVSLRRRHDGRLEVDQIKGKQNQPPVHRYVQDVQQFLEWAQPVGLRCSDCDRMGLVAQDGDTDDRAAWRFLSEADDFAMALNLLADHPHLIEHWVDPPAAAQWLLLSLGPNALAGVPAPDATVLAATRPLPAPGDGPASGADVAAPLDRSDPHAPPRQGTGVLTRWLLWAALYVVLHQVVRHAGGSAWMAPVAWFVAWRLLRRRRPGRGAIDAPVVPERHRWALALGDLQLRRNDLPCDTDALALDLPPDRRHTLRTAVLKELGIVSTEDDASVRQAVHQALCHWPSGLTPPHVPYAEQMMAAGQVQDMVAFQAARVAFLVRCAAALGLCDEAVAWRVLLLNAQRAQDTFTSWQDFGESYARARVAWLALEERDAPASQRAHLEVAAYLAEARGNWSTLPWSAYRLVEPEPVTAAPPDPAVPAAPPAS